VGSSSTGVTCGEHRLRKAKNAYRDVPTPLRGTYSDCKGTEYPHNPIMEGFVGAINPKNPTAKQTNTAQKNVVY